MGQVFFLLCLWGALARVALTKPYLSRKIKLHLG
jgi:hypothetical protein